jgi:hypothetical protein
MRCRQEPLDPVRVHRHLPVKRSLQRPQAHMNIE